MDSILIPAFRLQESMKELVVDPALHGGIQVSKITSNGAIRSRIISLSSDNLALFITHEKIKHPNASATSVAARLPVPMYTLSKGFSFSGSKRLTDQYTRHIDASDLDGWQTGVIGTIKLENARARNPKLSWDRLVHKTITIFHHGLQTVDFIVENDNHRNALIKAMEEIRKRYHANEQTIANDSLLLRYVWYDIDTDKDAKISEKEFLKLCDRINLQKSDLKKKFKDFLRSSNSTRKKLVYGECKALLQSIKSEMTVSMTEEIFSKIFGDDFKQGVSAKDLLKKFLKQAQGDGNASLGDAKRLIATFQTLEMDTVKKNNTADTLTDFDAFEEYLLSESNDAYDPRARESSPKLDKPISHYWINTSHNTYLTGDQLKSRSSVEAYVKSLMRGCKCLELDCWDGDEKTNKAVVYHGFTLTTKILFRDICLVVKSYIDANGGELPIILSLENHCSHPFQRVMAQDMEEIFGSLLFVPSEKEIGKNELPSPESLRGMILVKGKRPEQLDDIADDETTDAEIDGDDPYSDQYNGAPVEEIKKDPKKLPKIVQELARLTLFHGNKFKSFQQSKAQDPSHMHSFSETKVAKIIQKKNENSNLWRAYNVSHMSRTYPAGIRVDSSNYNPLLGWSLGCQLVALNFQTHDTNLMLNDGRFLQGGGCGYVPKPMSTMKARDFRASNRIVIKVLKGNCIPKPRGDANGEIVDPYITVELHDIDFNDGKEEVVISSETTPVISDNGFSPLWDSEEMTFEARHPDVAMFLFKVIDQDLGLDDHIASAAVPVSCLRRGYRSLQLRSPVDNSRTGPFMFASLLVHIDHDMEYLH
ncbi:unnamed protein product [Cylindrotheca closterium]|uniref:Phosphoinositide phospholipase C n=1 Tax=Cylindrotheca closterium TaxID=2856 RepID=A0AAD2JM35_9STRA|nr:unnamed protein product [Cylindrotheca closterium]